MATESTCSMRVHTEQSSSVEQQCRAAQNKLGEQGGEKGRWDLPLDLDAPSMGSSQEGCEVSILQLGSQKTHKLGDVLARHSTVTGTICLHWFWHLRNSHREQQDNLKLLPAAKSTRYKKQRVVQYRLQVFKMSHGTSWIPVCLLQAHCLITPTHTLDPPTTHGQLQRVFQWLYSSYTKDTRQYIPLSQLTVKKCSMVRQKERERERERCVGVRDTEKKIQDREHQRRHKHVKNYCLAPLVV